MGARDRGGSLQHPGPVRSRNSRGRQHHRALAAEVSGRGKIRLLVNDPAKAKRALRKAKYRASDEPAFVVRLQNKPGALARVAAKLAKARINIRSAYATTSGRGSAIVVLTVGNPTKARSVLGR